MCLGLSPLCPFNALHIIFKMNFENYFLKKFYNFDKATSMDILENMILLEFFIEFF